MPRPRFKVLLPALFLLAAGAGFLALPTQADSAESAWEAMLRDNPGLAEHSTVGPLERQVLQVLSPEQAEAWMAGEDPAGIALADGLDLAAFLEILTSVGPGLVFHPLPGCTLANTKLAGGAFLPPREP